MKLPHIKPPSVLMNDFAVALCQQQILPTSLFSKAMKNLQVPLKSAQGHTDLLADIVGYLTKQDQ